MTPGDSPLGWGNPELFLAAAAPAAVSVAAVALLQVAAKSSAEVPRDVDSS